MKLILFLTLIFFPFNLIAQRSTCDYIDVDNAIYKKVIQQDSTIITTYYNKKGKKLSNICSLNNDSLIKIMEDTVFRLISKQLKIDTANASRGIGFCFTVSREGISNLRITYIKVPNYSKTKIEEILKSSLNNSVVNMFGKLECMTFIELEYFEYAFLPLKREHRSLGYPVK